MIGNTLQSKIMDSPETRVHQVLVEVNNWGLTPDNFSILRDLGLKQTASGFKGSLSGADVLHLNQYPWIDLIQDN